MDVLVVKDTVGRTLVYGPFESMESMDDFIAAYDSHWHDWTVVTVLEPVKESVPDYNAKPKKPLLHKGKPFRTDGWGHIIQD